MGRDFKSSVVSGPGPGPGPGLTAVAVMATLLLSLLPPVSRGPLPWAGALAPRGVPPRYGRRPCRNSRRNALVGQGRRAGRYRWGTRRWPPAIDGPLHLAHTVVN